MAFHRIDRRLAEHLSRLSRETGKRDLAVTHQMLADELGTSREVISRILESFESQGWVALGRKRITVLHEAGLPPYPPSVSEASGSEV